VALAEGRELKEAVEFAVSAGAIACTRYGAQPSMPERKEIDEMMHI
jgi:ribokinase